MTEKVHSTDEENYNDYGLDENCLNAMSDVKINERFIVYEASKINYVTSDFINIDLIEDIASNAFGEVGEYSENWSNDLYAQRNEIIKIIKKEIDNYCDKENMNPKFYGVEKVKKMIFRKISSNNYYRCI